VSRKKGSDQLARYWLTWLPGTASSRNRCPPPRHALPAQTSWKLVGGRRMSKFDSSRTICPTTPASLLTPTPNISRPVRASLA
jgi:hypothetical protein